MKKNIFANILGRFWNIFSNFLFIPLYIHYLGVESYSLLSFGLVLIGIMAVFDSGLTATLSREFASNTNDLKSKSRIFYTLESCYFIISTVILLTIILLSSTISYSWLNLTNFSKSEVNYYLKIIAFDISFIFISKFYFGGLLGFEKQVKANIIQVLYGVTRNGLVIILMIFKPSIEIFLIWQTITSCIYAFSLRVVISNLLGFTKSKRFDIIVIKRVWKFAGGMLLITLVAGLNTQMDKLAISKLLSFENLGYYTLAVSLSHSVNILTNPISIAILPRFTALYSKGQIDDVNELFEKVFRIISIVIVSSLSIFLFNSQQLLWIWTGSKELAYEAYKFVPFISISYSMLAIATIPYNIAIANGYTKLNNYMGLFSLIVTVPGYWIMTNIYGGIGAAITFCIVQSTITITYIYILNRRFRFTSKISNLYFQTLLKPFALSIALGFMLNHWEIVFSSRIYNFLWLGMQFVVILLINCSLFIPSKQYVNYTNLKYFIEKLIINGRRNDTSLKYYRSNKK